MACVSDDRDGIRARTGSTSCQSPDASCTLYPIHTAAASGAVFRTTITDVALSPGSRVRRSGAKEEIVMPRGETDCDGRGVADINRTTTVTNPRVTAAA